jgi:hypothetical protein
MPFDDDAPTASMNFPPRITLTFLVLPYISSASAKLAMCSKSGPLHYSQSLLSIEYPSAISSTTVVDEKKSVVAKHKAKGKVQSKGKSNDKMKPSLLDSPAMGTWSKKSEATRSAMSTRSKKKT